MLWRYLLFSPVLSLFFSPFSLEGPSMRGTKNKNDCVSNSYLTLCLICQLLKVCSEVRTCLIMILSIMVMPLHQSTFCELWTTRFHWYRPILSKKESHVLLEVIHIYVNQYMNLTKATSGAAVKCQLFTWYNSL